MSLSHHSLVPIVVSLFPLNIHPLSFFSRYLTLLHSFSISRCLCLSPYDPLFSLNTPYAQSPTLPLPPSLVPLVVSLFPIYIHPSHFRLSLYLILMHPIFLSLFLSLCVSLSLSISTYLMTLVSFSTSLSSPLSHKFIGVFSSCD